MAVSDPDASWWLKVERAEQNLIYVKNLLDGVRGPDLRAMRVEKQFQGGRWRYTGHSDMIVPRMLPLAIGDFLFDLMSALDHIATVNATGVVNPQSYFKIFTKDVRVANSQESQAHPRWHSGWKKFESQITPKVFAVIEAMQPFETVSKQSPDPNDSTVAILNSLHNSDKHKTLNIVNAGIDNLTCWFIQPNGVTVPILGNRPKLDDVMQDGAQFFTSQTEVEVELYGTIKVAVRGEDNPAYRLLPDTLDEILEDVRIALTLIEQAM